MHVTLDTIEGFNRRMRVEIPEDRIADLVNEKLQSLVSTTMMPGFRPGKVPIKLIARHHGPRIRGELLNQLIPQTFQEASVQEKIFLASDPEFSEINAEIGEGVSYTATFEVYPELELPEMETLEIERPVSEVTDEDVDRMVETLREQNKTWSAVDRPAVEGDRVIVDFEGTVVPKPGAESDEGSDAQATRQEITLNEAMADEFADPGQEDTPPETLKGTSMPVELGKGKMIEGFEDGLMGARADEERTLALRFPDKYHRPELSGCPVTFTVRMRSVEESALPETDEDFAARLGLQGAMDEIREATRRDLSDKLEFTLREITNTRTIGALLKEMGEIELPRGAIVRESSEISQRKQDEFKQIGIEPEALGITPEKFEGEARQRLILGLLLGKLVSISKITIDPTRVRQRVERLAASYQEPREMIKWYYEEPARIRPVESAVLREQAVDWILERANVTEEQVPLAGLLR